MRKIIFHLDAGFAGMDAHENALVEDDVSNEALDQEAWERALEHAETYNIYPTSDLDGLTDKEFEDINLDDYTDNIEGWWELYNPEKHDSLVAGGGDWVW